MLDERISGLLNDQINKELYSAYLYLSFSHFYTEKGLNGFAGWFLVQAQEERDHALLIVRYLQNNDAAITFEAIDRPDAAPDAAIDPLKAALVHEQYVTGLIHQLCEAAQERRDFRTLQFLDWFVKEQGEEEATVSELIKRMELFGADPRGLYLLDSELGSRVYAPPTLAL